jgi:hypothetical protein
MKTLKEIYEAHRKEHVIDEDKRLVKKADLCTTLARMMLHLPDTEMGLDVERTAVVLMHLPIEDLLVLGERLCDYRINEPKPAKKAKKRK